MRQTSSGGPQQPNPPGSEKQHRQACPNCGKQGQPAETILQDCELGLSVLRVLPSEERGEGLAGAVLPGPEECLKLRVNFYLGNGTSWF